MKAKVNLIIVLLSLFFAADAFAGTDIKSEVDKLKLAAGQELVYKVTVTSGEANTPPLQLPEFKDFEVLSSQESSTITFTKDGIKSVLVSAIILSPREAGKFKIGPAQIKVKNKTYSSQSFEIEVSPGKPAPSGRPKEKPSPEEKVYPDPGSPQVTL